MITAGYVTTVANLRTSSSVPGVYVQGTGTCASEASAYIAALLRAIDTDSHAVGHLDVMRFGVATAQRGWLSKDDVINAWPIGKLERFLRKGRTKAAAR